MEAERATVRAGIGREPDGMLLGGDTDGQARMERRQLVLLITPKE